MDLWLCSHDFPFCSARHKPPEALEVLGYLLVLSCGPKQDQRKNHSAKWSVKPRLTVQNFINTVFSACLSSHSSGLEMQALHAWKCARFWEVHSPVPQSNNFIDKLNRESVRSLSPPESLGAARGRLALLDFGLERRREGLFCEKLN